MRNITKAKWVALNWMQRGDVPADALADLRATHNQLSVWRVESGDAAGLKMALAALASNREKLDNLDYTLLDEALLPAIPTKYVKSDGATPHLAANGDLHCDLTDLTAGKVLRIAEAMMQMEHIRVPQSEVKRLLLDAVEEGALDRDKIDDRLKYELGIGELKKCQSCGSWPRR